MKKLNKIQINDKVSVVHNSRNVCSVYFSAHPGFEQWILLTSDRHHDSVYCDRELELEHLEKAKQRKALIIDAGDVFDVMQGKFDPRRNYDELRPEYKAGNMLDLIVDDTAKFLGPYASQFIVIGRGNHDQKVLQNSGTDMVSNLVYSLNRDYGGKIQVGGYGGWVRFMFNIQTQCLSKKLKYHHGAGGGGPVTRGVIQTNRQAVYLPDADIVMNGHTHDSFIVPIARERLTELGEVKQDIQYHIRTTTYKNEYRDGALGWHVETWKPPKPLGAVWLRFYYEKKDIKMDFVPDVK
jgi:predicted phosphodiesterase